MRKLTLLLLLQLLFLQALSAQNATKLRSSDFAAVCDSLTLRCNEHFGVLSSVSLKRIVQRSDVADLHFTHFLSEYPWHEGDAEWFRQTFIREAESVLGGVRPSRIYTDGQLLSDLETPPLTNDGTPPQYSGRIVRHPSHPLVRRVGANEPERGLWGRHIALWQSHGCYYDEGEDRWKWQRSTLHRTVEDMFTQGIVLDYLIPMLERAGATVFTPRERDIQRQEVVCDNDPAFNRNPGGAPLRAAGMFKTSGTWKSGPVGFADLKQEYEITDNPFKAGSTLTAACSLTPDASAVWTPVIPQKGSYAVYVSYASTSSSNPTAHYTVTHAGGKTDFIVDQTRGGGTWIYLGTFEFGPGTSGSVELDNKGEKGCTVSADAVRFGGGMGKIRRGGRLSGYPAYMEGASYSMPWYGADSTMRAWDGDYTNDYAVRGAWTRALKDSLGIPVDCSIAVHSDAGIAQADTTIGTLVIYSLRSDGSRTYADGTDRITARTFADYVQTQIVDDVRSGFEPNWRRRGIWDKSYSESRTTGVPGVLLEFLSHQNFADMRYGLDPAFRFTVGRATYKAMLKYLSCRYGVPYTVQPLPVHAFSAVLCGDDTAELHWQPANDPLEPTAEPLGYTLYTRIDDGAFDDGRTVINNGTFVTLEPGHVYSWKVEAWNEGGSSFPSEVLSAGVPESNQAGSSVLVVNNFTRIAAPSWIDYPEYAGFDSRLDEGMPYVRDITYIGENYDFRRDSQELGEFAPGHGASFSDKAGLVVAGNTFDYPHVHGTALLELGVPFCSASVEAFCADTTIGRTSGILDLICGAQVTTRSGSGARADGFQVFTPQLRDAISRWTSSSKNVLVSGSNIATDVWTKVYDIAPDSLNRVQCREFVRKTFGYRFGGSFATNGGIVAGMPFYHDLNEENYSCTHPDALLPASRSASKWMRYDTGASAGVLFRGEGYRAASLGVPIECLENPEDRVRVLREALDFFATASLPNTWK